MRDCGTAWLTQQKRRRNVTTIVHPASDDPVRDERFRLGIEGSGIGIWDLDLLTHRLLWSNTTRILFGVPKDLPLTHGLFLSILEPQDRERTEQAIRRSVDTGCTFDVQYHVGSESRRRWIRALGSIVRDETGAPRHLSGSRSTSRIRSRSKKHLGSGNVTFARSSRPYPMR